MFLPFPLGWWGSSSGVSSESPDATNSSLVALPASTTVGSVVGVTVTARDASDAPIANAVVELSSDESGTFAETSGVTDTNGLFVTTYVPNAVGGGTHTISADITSNGDTIAEADTVAVSAANLMVAMTGAPTNCVGVVVTPERFIFALGAGGDPRKVAWASQETLDDWTPSALNTAGDFILEGNGRIRCGRRARGETLIWTDTDLHAARYIGGILVYAFERVGTNCGIIAPNAVAMTDLGAVWMSHKGFFMYDGFVKPLPCEVFDKVFGDFNYTQRTKVWAKTNAQFGEVWFFYPSASTTECDRYVVWNYREGHWSMGSLARTAGIDRGAFGYPMMADADGHVYDHERGNVRTGLTPYAESGPVMLGAGDRVMRVTRIIPDEKTLGDVMAYLYTSMYPTAEETENGPYTLDEKTDVRLTARQVRLKLEEVAPDDWRVGTVRLDVKLGGKR